MASAGAGNEGGGHGVQNPNVEDLLKKLHLTEEEEAVLDYSEEDDDEVLTPVEWALVGKVLSPVPVHIQLLRSTMKSAWGNSIGLKIRVIGEKGDNLFVAEFGSNRDLERVMQGTPWMVGKFAVLLQEYNEKLSAAEIVFDKMEIWVRILNLPLGWMNRARGSRAMDMIGKVIKMDVDADGKASGAFLRARVAIEVDKPVRRGVFLRLSRNEEPKWFHVQYERLPYICFHCGRMGHSDLECLTPAERNEEGKLPYDVQLRAPEDRRRRVQSFAGAAAESFGSGSSSASKPPRPQSRSNGGGSRSGSRYSDSVMGDSEEFEVQSPLKQDHAHDCHAATDGALKATRKLDLGGVVEEHRQQPRKRKSKVGSRVAQTPDLNIPAGESNALVPVGLVTSRVNQLDASSESGGESMIETLKKQKCVSTQNEISAAAAKGGPRWTP